MRKEEIIIQGKASFYTNAYGAYRWDSHLQAPKKQWYLVSHLTEFDKMRGVETRHIECVVDDFGNLVGVK